MKAWHFVNDTLRDGSLVPEDGVTLTHDGSLIICEQGLHASERIIDALTYAPGNTICRVEITGCEAQGHDDKVVCRTRKILWRIDGKAVLREFARKCALDVIHLWNPPDVVRQYLETGDEKIRAAAWSAAWNAAWNAARDAAGAAAWNAARDAARAAAWNAARAPARDAARAAAWNAARAAARDAARAAAWNAARAAAWNAARAGQNARLTEMVEVAHGR